MLAFQSLKLNGHRRLLLLGYSSSPSSLHSVGRPRKISTDVSKNADIGAVPDSLPYVLRILATHLPERKKEPLQGDDVPSVDILITCCREELGVILDTTRAACVLDYPQDRYRIFVCDDGSSTEVREAIQSLRSIYPNVFYTARVKGPVKDYKAGNLNHGLMHSRMTPRPSSSYRDILEVKSAFSSRTTLVREKVVDPDMDSESFTLRPARVHFYKNPSSHSTRSSLTIADSNFHSALTAGSTISEYVAGLDADMIPEPHWLRTMLPHLVDDGDVALACPPQTFYDLPLNDPLTQTMDHFAGTTELINDAVGHADCLGSGYVARRSAIDSIGGFPLESLSEDVCCSSTLLGSGWKTAFVEEVLQHGSVPDSFVAHIKQRTRWFVGHVQTAMLFRFRLWGQRSRSYSLPQRLAGIVFDLRQIVQIPLALNYVLVPFSLWSGYPLVIWTENYELRWLIRLVVVWMVSRWFHQALMGIIFALGRGWYDVRMTSYDTELEQWLSPCKYPVSPDEWSLTHLSRHFHSIPSVLHSSCAFWRCESWLHRFWKYSL